MMRKVSFKILRRLLCAGLITILALYHLAAVTAAAAGEDPLSAESSLENAVEKNASAGTIRIGDTTFHSDDEVSSHWSEGRGWKNLPGQYVTMVDYNGAEAEVSKDSGVLTLAVAGVNRIGTLTGDCSVRIVGSGIVLIDKISISEGNTLSLHPNTLLYQEGSAAVFLKQENESYVCINGGIPGILDEDYTLENVSLTIPDGTEVVLAANSYDYAAATGKLTLGKGSILTVDSGASIRVEALTGNTLYLTVPASALVLQGGTAAINGTAKGPGNIDVKDGGLLKGSGSVQSAHVNMYSGGTLSTELLLDNAKLIPYDREMSVSARIKDSAVYLKAPGVDVKELQVQGTCWLGVDTAEEQTGEYYFPCKLGDVNLDSGGSLSVVCNEHSYSPGFGAARYVEDCSLEIYGTTTGGSISVLAGGAEYTGKQTANLPVVPNGYTSRVYFSQIDIDSTIYPMNMSKADAAKLAKDDEIRVVRMTVHDTLISEDILARKWVFDGGEVLDTLSRKENSWFTCQEFLEKYDQPGGMSENSYCTAVEVIYSDLSRDRFFYDQTDLYFSTQDVIEIRILDCIGKGGQGGTALSHTDTIFTGSGTLGGTGDGSATGGNGTSVYPQYGAAVTTEPPTTEPPTTEPTTAETVTQPTETATQPTETAIPPTETATQPTETATQPTETATQPTETATQPTETATQPTETATQPTETSTQPTETATQPTETATQPTETVPESGETETEPEETVTESSGEEETGTGETTTRAAETTTGSGGYDRPRRQETRTDGQWTTVVTEEGPGRYTLTVYKNGIKNDDLNGSSVLVRIREPEGITENDVCYVLFENGGQSSWIPANYDSTTRELSFETKQTGAFGIARSVIEDIPLPAANTAVPEYRKLSVLIGEEALTELPGPVSVEVPVDAEVPTGAEDSSPAGEDVKTVFYAVLVDENEDLHVYPVTCDETALEYRFEADFPGSFVILSLDDVPGTEHELYDACAADEDVRILITILRLRAFWR